MNLLAATRAVYQAVTDEGVDADATEIRRKIEGELELFDISVEEAAEIIESAIIEQAEEGPRYTPSTLYQEGGSADTTEESSTTTATSEDTAVDSTNTLVSKRQSISSLQPGQNATIEATVISLWNTAIPDIQHRGILADSSGYLRFTVWSNGSHHQLQCGESYRFQTVVTDEQENELVLNVTPRSSITKLDTDLDTPRQGRYEALGDWGTIIAIEEDSGNIARCSENDCSLVLSNRFCELHGRIDEPVEDFRITALLDDGDSVTRLIFSEELCSTLLGMTQDEFTQKVAGLSKDIPETEIIERTLIGAHYKVIGLPYNDSIIVGEFERAPPTDQDTTSATSSVG